MGGIYCGRRSSYRSQQRKKKNDNQKGVIEKAYPFFFTMITEVDGSSQRASFNYADILTKTIELEITHS